MKSLKEGMHRGFDHALKKLSIKTPLTCHVSWPLLELGELFGTSSCHLLFASICEDFRI